MSDQQKTKILVTGGAGFIGSHLTDELLAQGYRVVVLDNLCNGSLDNLKNACSYDSFEFIRGDINNRALCDEIMKNTDIVYHLACLGVRHSLHNPFDNHKVNAEGTLNILESVRKMGTRKFIYVSSSEIYGRVRSFPIREEDTAYPITVYGAGKLVGEYYTNSYHEIYKLDTTVIRLFNNYGPRAHYEGDCGEVIPRTIVNALYEKSPVLFGDGSISKDFFFVKDTARILAKLIDLKGISGETFNVGTGEEITIKALIEKILELTGKSRIKIEYLEERPADVPRLWVDNSKIKRHIAELSSYSFDEGLARTIEFYKELMKEKNLIADMKKINWTDSK